MKTKAVPVVGVCACGHTQPQHRIEHPLGRLGAATPGSCSVANCACTQYLWASWREVSGYLGRVDVRHS